MGRKFKITRDCYDEGEYLYKKKFMTFEPGLTVLIGCNGCGKTSLMQQVKKQLKDDLKLPFVAYDNQMDGGSHAMSAAICFADYGFAAQSFCSSEGEKISLNLQKIAGQIGQMFRKNPDKNEFWILLDGVDSGMSIDAVEDLKRGLFDTIFEHYHDKDIYLLVTANAYEMARGERCFDVVNGRYVTIKSYERYRKAILASREYKNARITKAAESQHEEEAEESEEVPDEKA